MTWANLTLKPTKAAFMTSSIEPLGLLVGEHVLANGKRVWGVRPSMGKLEKLRDYPVPQNMEEVDIFLYMTLYLKMFIPDRAEHARILKEAGSKVERRKTGAEKKRRGDERTEGQQLTGVFQWGPIQ